MKKACESALLVGRFNHIHKGHESLVETALSFSDRLLIMVGSSQEVGTERNPFDVSTRIDMIREIYDEECATGKIIVKPLPDLTNENDITPDWGRYVLDKAKFYIHKVPELMIYGNDECRSRWFDPEDIKDTLEIIVPRSKIKLSATEMREYLLLDNRDAWNERVNPRLHPFYDRLRSELMSVDFYRNRFNELINK